MKRKPLELYVHIPFCKKKCNYCDFLSAPASKPRRQEYMQALMTEIMIWSGAAYDNHEVKSIFIGGGTPSILEGDQIKALMRMLNIYFNISSSAEITIECNPGMVNKDKLLAYREAGINRLSIGLQSACDEELAVLGRIHTWADFAATYNLARQCGFTNINVDLMSALPGQTLESWTDTLKMVAELNPEHISAYSQIIEEGTPFYARYGELVNDDVQVGGKPAVAVGYTEDVTENADGTISAENGAKLVSVTDEMAAWLDANPDDLLAMSEFMREPLIEELPVLEELSEAINVLCKKTMESPDIKANKAYWTCYDIVGKVLFMDWYDAEFVKAQDIETEVDALRELIPGIRAAAERIYETVATRIEDSRSDVAPGEYRLSLRTDSTGNNTAHEQIHVSRPDGSLFYGLKLSYLYPAGSNNGNCTTVVYDSLYGGYIYLDDSYFFTRVSDNIHFTLDAVGTYDLSIDVKDYESLFD